jgi:hypothetical protein
MPNGTLAVAWFTGDEGTPNCSIAVSLLEIGSQQWTADVIAIERVNYSNRNSVLYRDNKTQILHLYHSLQFGNAGETKSEIWHVQSKHTLRIDLSQKNISDILGIAWSTPQSFYPTLGAFDRNRIIPTQKNDNTTTNSGYSFILRYKFATSTWTRTNILTSGNLIQPSIIRLNNSSNRPTFFRDRNAVSIYDADSIMMMD